VKIHALASLPHYREHIEAVHRHLPAALKGDWLFGRAARHTEPDDLIMIAGFQDITRAEGRKVVYVEHGAGQKYVGLPKGEAHYHGSEHPDNVVAYICPRQEVADSWSRPAYAAGSPVCDDFPLLTGNEQPVAAITFHWDCKLLPETRSALDHYVHDLGRIVKQLRAQGFLVLGHHHPRDTRLPKMWRGLGVQEADVRQVRSIADVLIADNTSLAYEMLYLQRSVVTLNAPWYRREVDHGLRFWDHIPGYSVKDADELLEAMSGPTRRVGDHDICEYVYGRWVSDGDDGFRAAAWVTAHAAEL
jgi:hypothetical protein